jgi:broad specificity phosphatase PhoE
MELWFVRHGEATNNVEALVTGHDTSPLTPRGREQVARLGRHMRTTLAFVPDVVVTSQMTRAMQSYEELGYEFDAQVVEELNEVDAGSVSLWPRRTFDETYLDFWAPFDPERKFPDGESHADLARRVNKSVAQLHERFAGAKVLMVAHAGTLSCILHEQFNVSLRHFSRFKANNGSVSVIRVGGRAEPPELLSFNVTA